MLLPDQLETLRRLRAEGEADWTAPEQLGVSRAQLDDVLEGKAIPTKAEKAIALWFLRSESR